MEKDNEKQPEEVKPPRIQINSEGLTQLITYLQGLQVGIVPTKASSSKEFILSSIAKSRLGTQELRRPSTKVLNEEFVKYCIALGGPRKIWKLRAVEQLAVPLCRSHGVVDAKDLVIGEKVVVLKNAGLWYNMEAVDFTKGNILSTFFLIFTEFESGGFLFYTMWQWEVGTWRESASSVWNILTLEMLNWEVPPTIYSKERKGTHEDWRFFE